MLRFHADFKGNDHACERKVSEFHGGWVKRKREREKGGERERKRGERKKVSKEKKKKGRKRAEKKNGGGKMRGERVRRHCVQLDCFSQRMMHKGA